MRVLFCVFLFLFYPAYAFSEVLKAGDVTIEYSCDDDRESCFVETISNSGATLSKITWGLHHLLGVGGGSGVFPDDTHKTIGKYRVLRKYGGYDDRVLLINETDGFIHDLPGEEICPSEKSIAMVFGLEGERKRLVFSLESQTIVEIQSYGDNAFACPEN